MDRAEAQARLNRIRAFEAELAALTHDGVITLDTHQQQAIADHHRQVVADLVRQFDLDRDEGQRRMSIGMRIASALGAVALSAAVFLFFYRIWGLLQTSAQVAILAAAPLAGIAATEVAHRNDRSGHFVFIAAAIACACIVLNVALVGDIFAMTSSPYAVAVWAAFGLAIGYGYGFRPPVAAGIGLAVIFCGAWILAMRGVEWTEIGGRPELVLLLASVAFAIGATERNEVARFFHVGYRFAALVLGLLALLALSIEGQLSVLPWSETSVQAFYQVAGFLVAGGAIALGLKRNWAETTNIGAAGFAAFLATKFYQWWWDWMPAYLFFLIVGLTAIALIVVLRRLRAMRGVRAR
jgi:hypothetical protein